MRILVAAERVGRAGGMERYLDIVLPALRARGAHVHVLARDAGENGAAGVEELRWSDEHEPPNARAADTVRRTIHDGGFDVAAAHNVMDAAVVEALRDARRFAYHVHDHRPFCPNGDRVYPRRGRTCTDPLGVPCAFHAVVDGCGYGPRLRTLHLIRGRERLRDAITAADVTIAASRYVAQRATDSGIDERRIAAIPLPLPAAAFAATPAASHDGSIVFAGRVVPQKGLGALVRAVGLLPQTLRPRVRAFGAGPALPETIAEAERRGVALDAPGTVGEDALRAGLDACAFAVLPSLWAEPFGYVGIEAFARGKPVVAFDDGGVRAWLADGENGVAVHPGDVRALSAAIAALLADDGLRERLGRRARADAERYRAEPIVDALLAAYAGDVGRA